MSEGTLKAEKDFSKEVDKLLPEATKLAKVRPVDNGISFHKLTIVK